MIGGFTTNEYLGTPAENRLDNGSAAMTCLVLAEVVTGVGFTVYSMLSQPISAASNRALELFHYHNNGSPRIGFMRDYAGTDVLAECSNGGAPATPGTHAYAGVDYGEGVVPRLFTAPWRQPLKEIASYQSQQAGTSGPVTTTQPFRIGNNYSGARPWGSNIYAVMVWGRALDLYELNQHALDPYRCSDQLVHLVFDDAVTASGVASGNTFRDRSDWARLVTVTGTLTRATSPKFRSPLTLSAPFDLAATLAAGGSDAVPQAWAQYRARRVA